MCSTSPPKPNRTKCASTNAPSHSALFLSVETTVNHSIPRKKLSNNNNLYQDWRIDPYATLPIIAFYLSWRSLQKYRILFCVQMRGLLGLDYQSLPPFSHKQQKK